MDPITAKLRRNSCKAHLNEQDLGISVGGFKWDTERVCICCFRLQLPLTNTPLCLNQGGGYVLTHSPTNRATQIQGFFHTPKISRSPSKLYMAIPMRLVISIYKGILSNKISGVGTNFWLFVYFRDRISYSCF